MKLELMYEEITEQATKTITEMLWLNLIAPVKNDSSCKLDCFLAIKKQSEIFEQLVDRESVPALNNEQLRP
ncbi:hypothetical protein [Escherichia coli]|uniref:hypothetical protein n=1 Tax=Escherichia coli TaxID=562 RepID=UPI001CDB38B4|nr:hypothetical protein [Escherichia coli]